MLETAVQLERIHQNGDVGLNKTGCFGDGAGLRFLLRAEETSDLMAMVGRTVSTVKMTVLLASEPSELVLPAESENFELATEITPLVVLLAVGVKVAV